VNINRLKMEEAIYNSDQKRFQEELTLIALQVVHDISSPIAILDTIQSTIDGIPEESRIILKSVITQIRDISNTLLKKTKQDLYINDPDITTPQMLICIIENVANEKRVQYQNKINLIIETDKKSHKIYSSINSLELSRVLSNLINNSVEARSNNK
jgi:signal transduction histidine kinase